MACHNKIRFFPVDAAFHTSKGRTNDTLHSMDKRCGGWKRRAETFRKKTEVLIEMLQRCHRNGIDARFDLFDDRFANDGLGANLVEIGNGVVHRLKATKTRYTYRGKSWTLKQLRHEVARCNLQAVPGWNSQAAVLNVDFPLSGTVRLVFVRWSKKQRHCFLRTETDPRAEGILSSGTSVSRRYLTDRAMGESTQSHVLNLS